MPEFTIEGDPAGIRAQAQVMRQHGGAFTDTGDALERVEVDGWRGRAADRFAEEFSIEPERWRDAGDGFVTAARALEAYADAVADAKAAAEWAEGEYARGQQVTEQARAAYEADVAQARADQAAAAARGGFLSVRILPFTDPGEEIRQAAVSEYERAKAGLENAAQVCADGVRAGCAAAPQQRRFNDHKRAFFDGARDALTGMVTATPFSPVNLTQDAWKVSQGDLTPDELMGKYQLDLEQYQGLMNRLESTPGAPSVRFKDQETAEAFGKSMLDWDTWADDPARAAGRLAPDAVASAVTGGYGGAATRGLNVGTDILDATGDMARITNVEDLQAGTRLEDFTSPLDDHGSTRAIHADSATPDQLEPLLASRYPETLTVNQERLWNGVPESGHAPRDFQYNCTRCVLATDSSLGGSPTSAMPIKTDGAPVTDVTDGFGRKFGAPTTFADISQHMETLGPGSRGVVLGTRDGIGHVFNVVNDGGTTVFLDGQSGSFAKLENFNQVLLLQTHP